MLSPTVFGDSQNGEKSSVMSPPKKGHFYKCQTRIINFVQESTPHHSAHLYEVEDACYLQANTIQTVRVMA